MALNELVNEKSSTIIDVRTSMEFIGGHVTGSVNIPVNEIPGRLEEIKQLSKPLILCCASGGRSGQAQAYLIHQGITDVYNAGSWTMVQLLKL
ncbi:MAG: rhodanese-like domain-containing protein [Sphingobacteriales bacterium]|nr:rhodanese-like domain-containing protein [Sphingobacteriales bacterium]MBI3718090.1 rhodanese-like domain-containing protein [Sphingobacteriales bacterium]